MFSIGGGTSESQESSQGTQTPPEYAQRMQEANMGLLNYMTQPFLDVPANRVAGFNADQLQAFDLAAQNAQNAFAGGPTVAPSGQITAYQGQPVSAAEFYSAGPAAQTGPAAQAGFTSAGPAQGYTAQQAQFNATGPAQGYTAQQAMGAGNAAQVNQNNIPHIGGAGASATLAGPAATSQFVAANQQQLDPNAYKPFLNPYTQEVVNTTQTQMGRANAEQDAARNAAYAKAGAFGGSRQAVAQGVSDARYTQDVGNMTAQLMSQGYNFATAQAMANTQLRQQTELANSQLNTQNNQFNAGAQNALSGLNAQLGTQASIASANNYTQGNVANGQILANILSGNRDALNEMSRFNSDKSFQNAQMLNDAAKYSATAANDFMINDSKILNDLNLQNALAGNKASEFSANAANAMNVLNTNNQNANAQYNATNLLQNAQYNATNQQQQNQYNTTNQLANSQYNAGANNAFNQFQIGQNNAINTQNAANAFQQAAQQNQFKTNQLQNEQTAIQQLLGIGNQQQQLAQAGLDIPYNTLQMMIGLTNQTAQAGREQQSSSQKTSSESKFNIGLPFFGS